MLQKGYQVMQCNKSETPPVREGLWKLGQVRFRLPYFAGPLLCSAYSPTSKYKHSTF
jgi:hypothetical protein